MIPSDRWEFRILAATSLVRFLIMPLAALGIVSCLAASNLLPDDSACKLVLLVSSAMPSAQNLVTMVNLSPETKPLASKMARLLFRQSILAILPITFWLSYFISYIHL